jgi:hypothetical protein
LLQQNSVETEYLWQRMYQTLHGVKVHWKNK